MDTNEIARLLPIGEFAAATQLSPKALRLYDEQRLLRPAMVDTASGYRYYRNDQIAAGRLIRTLREMDLSLAGIADVVSAERGCAEALLREFAQEGDRRFAREKRAFQTALALLHQASAIDPPTVAERMRPAVTVAVRPFLAERRFLLECFRGETALGYAALADAGLVPAGEPFCVLVDPVSEEEGRLEVAIPIVAPAAMPSGVAIRQVPPRRCAALVVEPLDSQAPDLTAGLDALFDWFDRRGHRAIEPPTVSFVFRDSGMRAEITWAYESTSAPAGSRGDT
jgi:DNA-binding transcriptional MerR regulator